MQNAAVNLKYIAAWKTIFLSHENVNMKAYFPAKMKIKSQSSYSFMG